MVRPLPSLSLLEVSPAAVTMVVDREIWTQKGCLQHMVEETGNLNNVSSERVTPVKSSSIYIPCLKKGSKCLTKH